MARPMPGGGDHAAGLGEKLSQVRSVHLSIPNPPPPSCVRLAGDFRHELDDRPGEFVQHWQGTSM